MSFLPQPYYLDRDDMVKFILAIPETGWSWKPVGITWHNAGAPNIKQWDAYPEAVRAAWGGNYDHYCRVDQGWHSGPHFCGTPDKSFVLCEPRANGVHASCYNSDHFGIETVGDFRTGGDDPLSGRGLLSMKSSANIIAALCKRMGWEPAKAINFHRSCTRDGHPCPGNLVTDAWAIGLVEARLAELNGAPVVTAPPLSADGAVRVAAMVLKSAVIGFQRAYGLDADGDPGYLTRAAYLKAVAA